MYIINTECILINSLLKKSNISIQNLFDIKNNIEFLIPVYVDFELKDINKIINKYSYKLYLFDSCIFKIKEISDSDIEYCNNFLPQLYKNDILEIIKLF